ncbi:MAG: metallophosphoesterase [Alphaproteobacteria bacterium]|nr:metallophosphoesterase [Alphaproteobacteria bacterium]
MLLLALLACTEPEPKDDTSDSTPARAAWTTPPPSVLEAPERLVGFADVHGDLDATLAVLALAGLIDDQQRWAGGETVVVQTGDQLDRGDDEQAILDLFERLSQEAWDAGGGFYPLLGNHETMNVELDLRYVTEGGFADFADTPYEADDAELLEYPEAQRGRVAALRPGGPYAQLLAGHNMVMQVGDTVFVHGGVLPEHAEVGLETINAEVQAWIRGDAAPPERWLSGDGPVWTRDYSDDEAAPACEALTEALELLGAARMVVGHTVQDQANPACDGKVWRMDVGMAAYYGGRPAALELRDGEATLLQ